MPKSAVTVGSGGAMRGTGSRGAERAAGHPRSARSGTETGLQYLRSDLGAQKPRVARCNRPGARTPRKRQLRFCVSRLGHGKGVGSMEAGAPASAGTRPHYLRSGRVGTESSTDRSAAPRDRPQGAANGRSEVPTGGDCAPLDRWPRLRASPADLRRSANAACASTGWTALLFAVRCRVLSTLRTAWMRSPDDRRTKCGRGAL